MRRILSRLFGDEARIPGRSGRLLAGIPVLVAALGMALLFPHSANPEVVPLPNLDRATLAAIVRDDDALASRARAEGLPSEVREFGSLVREWNRLEATSTDTVPLQTARAAMERSLTGLLAKGPDALRRLRAVQLDAFLAETRAFERSGTISEELVALAGPFVERMRAVGWCIGHRLLLTEDERRAAYKMTWNGIAGLDRRPDFALALDETRALYGLYLRLPHAPEGQLRGFEAARKGAKDAAACDALTAGERMAAEGWRLERIGRLAAIDRTYPAAYARGIAQFRLQRFSAAVDSFQAHLRDHPEGPYALKARNYLRASLAAAHQNEM